jgi:hypothetical protein
VLLAVRFADACNEKQNTLETIVRECQNEKVRTRAVTLIKKYKNWDDTTYQKSLRELGDSPKTTNIQPVTAEQSLSGRGPISPY